jgi:hypothetical protein
LLLFAWKVYSCKHLFLILLEACNCALCDIVTDFAPGSMSLLWIGAETLVKIHVDNTYFVAISFVRVA